MSALLNDVALAMQRSSKARHNKIDEAVLRRICRRLTTGYTFRATRVHFPRLFPIAIDELPRVSVCYSMILVSINAVPTPKKKHYFGLTIFRGWHLKALLVVDD